MCGDEVFGNLVRTYPSKYQRVSTVFHFLSVCLLLASYGFIIVILVCDHQQASMLHPVATILSFRAGLCL